MKRDLAVAEANGNRTRQGALAPSPVLKTGGPTRRPDASVASIRAFGEAKKSTETVPDRMEDAR